MENKTHHFGNVWPGYLIVTNVLVAVFFLITIVGMGLRDGGGGAEALATLLPGWANEGLLFMGDQFGVLLLVILVGTFIMPRGGHGFSLIDMQKIQVSYKTRGRHRRKVVNDYPVTEFPNYYLLVVEKLLVKEIYLIMREVNGQYDVATSIVVPKQNQFILPDLKIALNSYGYKELPSDDSGLVEFAKTQSF